MSTPACIANAVADALGVNDISLPLTPLRLHALLAGEEGPPARAATPASSPSPLVGEGRGGGSGNGALLSLNSPTPTPDPSPQGGGESVLPGAP